MPQLPRTSRQQRHNLQHTIPHRPRIRRLAQIPKIRLPLPLILLLPPHVLQLQIQLPHLTRDLADVRPVLFDVGLRGADDDVEVEPDVGLGAEPGGGVVRGEADGVVAGFVGGEGEAGVWGSAGLDDGVVGFHFLCEGEADEFLDGEGVRRMCGEGGSRESDLRLLRREYRAPR